MAGSIIVDWAFATAVGAAGEEIDSFLAVQEEFRRAEARSVGLAGALLEVERLGRWVRIYLMADLCAIARNRPATPEATIAKRMLLDLIGGEEEVLRDMLNSAVRDATGSSETREILATLERGAARWLKTEDPSDFSSLLDYSDIEVFTAPALILAMASVLAVDGILDTQRGSATGRISYLAQLTAAAMAGRYGRLAFTLALDLGLAAPALAGDEAVVDALTAIPPDKLALAPDLLVRLARLKLLAANDQTARGQSVSDLAQELITLRVFRAWFGADAARWTVTAVAFWSSAICNLMLDIDQKAATHALSAVWLPRIQDPALPHKVAVPLAVVSDGHAALLQLMHVRRGRGGSSLDVHAYVSASLAEANVVLSPWLVEKAWSKQTSFERLRFLCGIALDIRVLENQPFERVMAPFALHLLSAVETLRRYRNFARATEAQWEYFDRINSGHLGWLSRRLLISGSAALSGDGRVALKSLIELLDDAQRSPAVLPELDASAIDPGLRERLIRRLATGALRLVENALASNSRTEEAGWLGVADQVVELHAACAGEGEGADDRKVPLAAEPSDDVTLRGLITRYFVGSPDERFMDANVLAVVNGDDENKGTWAVKHRRLLLAPTSSAKDWIGPGDAVGTPGPYVQLVRAMLRVVAVKEDPSLDPKTAAVWREDLKLKLRQITSPLTFDRFARMKVIDMVASGIFDGHEDLLFPAVTTSIVFGGPIQIRALIRAVTKSEIRSEAAANTRLAIYCGLIRYLADAAARREGASASAKECLLYQLKASCLFVARPDQRDVANYILELAREERQAARAGQPVTRPVPLAMEAVGAGEFQTGPVNDPTGWLAPVTAQMIALNVAAGVGYLLQSPPPVTGAVNSFAQQALARPGPRLHLGVVEFAYGGERGGQELEVRFARDKLAMTLSNDAHAPSFGELVVVDSASEDGPAAQRARRVIRLDPRVQRGSVAQVTPVVPQTHIVARLRVETADGARTDWTLKSFNFAALQQTKLDPYEIWCQNGVGGSADGYEPAELDLSDLLIDKARQFADGGAVTLALHDALLREDTLVDLVIEAKPLQLYRILPDIGLTGRCRRVLAEELARLTDDGRDPRGLLISFTIKGGDLGPQLDLAAYSADAAAICMEADYPELQLPFDDRNLWWRELFGGAGSLSGDGADREVTQSTGLIWGTFKTRYVFEIEPATLRPGFPTRLRVNLEDPSELSAGYVELAPNSWNPWEATLSGLMETRSLDLPSRPADKGRVIRDLDTLGVGSVLPLQRVANSVRGDGRVYGYTAANFAVLVNAETISMQLPCNPRQNWPGGREVMITYFEWRPIRTPLVIQASDIPGDIVENGRARGYLSAIPVDVAGAASCKIIWLRFDGKEVSEADLWIEIPARRGETVKIPQGSRIDVVIEEGRVEAGLFEPYIVGDALWKREPDLAPGEATRGEYIGSTRMGDEGADIYEAGRGFFTLQSKPGGHVSARECLRRVLAVEDDYLLTTDGVYRFLWDHTLNSSTRRCALAITARKAIAAGVTPAELMNGPVRLTGLQMRVRQVPGDGRFLLERRFQLQREQERGASARRPNEDLPRARRGEVEPAIEIGAQLEGRYDRASHRLLVRGVLRRRFPVGLAIDPNRVQRAPLGRGEYYPGDDARAVLISTDPPVGSFTDVPPSDLEHLRVRFGASRDEETSHQLDPTDVRLVFVGRERATVEESQGEEWLYLFEWGYGAWLKLRGEEVRYRDEPIERAEFLLFFGDRISAAAIADDDAGPKLVIRAVVPSRGHELYRHSSRSRVVNLLHIAKGHDGEPVIVAIEGFDPNRSRPSATIALPHARLDAAGQTVLGDRLSSAPSQRILGRLDSALFEESWGEALVFRYTRMDLQDSLRGLQKGDRTFVTAGDIAATRNDVGLRIHHPDLHLDDVAESFLEDAKRSQLILRRAFSFREETLGNILSIDGAKALQGDTMMICLTGDDTSSLNDGSLPRNPAIVRSLLQLGQEVLAVYGGHSGAEGQGDSKLIFELQPGVVVGLDPHEIDEFASLFKGDLVRIRLVNEDRLAIELAAPSDVRLATPHRPAVLLPRQTLTQAEGRPPYPDPRAKRRATGAFSVGDLPGLTAIVRSWGDDGRPVAMSDAAFIAFMSQGHPKLGELWLNAADDPEQVIQFTPGLSERVMAGRLRFSQARQGAPPPVEVMSLKGPPSGLSTDWHFLSYRDVPAVELEWLAASANWRFHDNDTTVWSCNAAGAVMARLDTVPPVTAAHGPLFFDVIGGTKAALRRPPRQLAKYAAGPNALLAPLAQTGEQERKLDAVAAAPYPDGLFIELYPGRIVQAPSGMARGLRHGVHIPLHNLDWESFGPGDRLSIGAAERPNVLVPIEFDLDWVHGPRNAFGPKGAVLECDPGASDARRGLAGYGAGSIRLKLPSQDIDAMPKIAVVGGAEHLSPLPSDLRDLQHCTVLAVETDDRRIAIHGLPKVNVFPDANWPWEDDQLLSPAVRRNNNGAAFIFERLFERIRLAGGALPLTIEFVSAGNPSVVYVSRRHQYLRPNEGRMILAQLYGKIGSTRWAQLGVGARHFAVSVDTLLPGISGEDIPDALAALAERQELIWLRSVDGRLQPGYSSETTSTVTVTPVCTVGREHAFVGVICEGLSDGKLRWLPAAEATACELTFAEAKAAFASPQLTRFHVTCRAGGDVSILEHPRAKAELERLRLGASLFVELVKDSTVTRPFWEPAHVDPKWAKVLARSKETSVIFAMAAPEAAMRRETFQAEVVVREKRGNKIKILLTVAGERLAAPDGPVWLFGDGQPPWAGEEGARYLRLSADLDGADVAVAALTKGGPENLEWEVVRDLTSRYIRTDSVSLLLGIGLCGALEQCRVAGGVGPVNGLRHALLRNLFARAIRSVPLEHLAIWALSQPTEVSPFTRIRYEEMSRLYRYGRLEEARSAAERWLDGIAVEPVKPPEEALANALGVMIGVCRNDQGLVNEARLLPKVIAATRPVHLAAVARSITLDAATLQLKEVGRSLLDGVYDIPLRPPLHF